MVNTFSVRIFRLEILDYLSRRSEHFGNFPVGNTKIALPVTFQPSFQYCFVLSFKRCSAEEDPRGATKNGHFLLYLQKPLYSFTSEVTLPLKVGVSWLDSLSTMLVSINECPPHLLTTFHHLNDRRAHMQKYAMPYKMVCDHVTQ